MQRLVYVCMYPRSEVEERVWRGRMAEYQDEGGVRACSRGSDTINEQTGTRQMSTSTLLLLW